MEMSKRRRKLPADPPILRCGPVPLKTGVRSDAQSSKCGRPSDFAADLVPQQTKRFVKTVFVPGAGLRVRNEIMQSPGKPTAESTGCGYHL